MQDIGQVIGLCRFSYPALGGFQVEHESIEVRMAYLWSEARLEERLRLFETVALPCLRAQTDDDFDLIVMIGDTFPKAHEARLRDLVAGMPQVQVVKEPPQQMRRVCKAALNRARRDPKAPCLQFRYDDDDAVSVDFVASLRAVASDCADLLARHRSVAFDWTNGYIARFGPDGIAAAECHDTLNVAALAMWVKGGAQTTIMNFNHKKLRQFMPCLSLAGPPMYVRSHNTFNDSRQKLVKQTEVKALNAEDETLFRQRFAIDADHVRRVFSGA